MNVVRGLILGCMVLALAGCGGGGGNRDLIIGKWKASEKKGGVELSATVEFSKEGRVKLDMGGISVTGKYKFIDDNTFEQEIEVLGKKVTEKVKIESLTKDKMVTIDKEGKKAELVRAN